MSLPSNPPPTVLIIDDDELALTTQARFLGLEGYDVRTAATAVAGLKAVEAGRPDAVLLDLKLPTVNDGLAVLRELRSRDETIPVAVVTGYYGLDDRTDAEIRRLHSRIAYKPLWSENVLALVRDLVGDPVKPASASD